MDFTLTDGQRAILHPRRELVLRRAADQDERRDEREPARGSEPHRRLPSIARTMRRNCWRLNPNVPEVWTP